MSDTYAAYIESIRAWRVKREADLRASDSWLSLVGLFWLQPGLQTIGSGPDCDITLPASAPAQLGVIDWRDKVAYLSVTTSREVKVAGQPARAATLVDNADHKAPALVTCGTVTFFVHTSGDNYAIRVKDSTNPAITEFAGCNWFEVKPEYRIRAKYVRRAAPQAMEVTTLVNTVEEITHTGHLEFELHGQALSLVVADGGGPNRLWIILRDQTAGTDTYAACRFMHVDVLPDGSVDLDFNKAYNPPCAFTMFATCPLPPKENILPVRIEAGERAVDHH